MVMRSPKIKARNDLRTTKVLEDSLVWQGNGKRGRTAEDSQMLPVLVRF